MLLSLGLAVGMCNSKVITAVNVGVLCCLGVLLRGHRAQCDAD
jgi:hypothetical protein